MKIDAIMQKKVILARTVLARPGEKPLWHREVWRPAEEAGRHLRWLSAVLSLGAAEIAEDGGRAVLVEDAAVWAHRTALAVQGRELAQAMRRLDSVPLGVATSARWVDVVDRAREAIATTAIRLLERTWDPREWADADKAWLAYLAWRGRSGLSRPDRDPYETRDGLEHNVLETMALGGYEAAEAAARERR